MNDENGFVPDLIDDDDGNKIPSEIFFSKEIGDDLSSFITDELDKQLIDKLKKELTNESLCRRIL